MASVNRNPNVVTVNLTDKDAKILDALVHAGVGDSRRGAVAWCIRHFKASEADWPETFRQLVDPILTEKDREERKLVHRVATRVSKRLEAEILATPSGRLRDLLTDATIIIDVYRNGGSLQTVAQRLERVARERDLLLKEDK